MNYAYTYTHSVILLLWPSLSSPFIATIILCFKNLDSLSIQRTHRLSCLLELALSSLFQHQFLWTWLGFQIIKVHNIAVRRAGSNLSLAFVLLGLTGNSDRCVSHQNQWLAMTALSLYRSNLCKLPIFTLRILQRRSTNGTALGNSRGDRNGWAVFGGKSRQSKWSGCSWSFPQVWRTDAWFGNQGLHLVIARMRFGVQRRRLFAAGRLDIGGSWNSQCKCN